MDIYDQFSEFFKCRGYVYRAHDEIESVWGSLRPEGAKQCKGETLFVQSCFIANPEKSLLPRNCTLLLAHESKSNLDSDLGNTPFTCTQICAQICAQHYPTQFQHNSNTIRHHKPIGSRTKIGPWRSPKKRKWNRKRLKTCPKRKVGKVVW